MSQAFYFSDPDLSLKTRLTVVKTNEDGTVDLADSRKNVVVTSCPVWTSPKLGHAVVLKGPKEEAPDGKGKAKEEK